MLIYLQLIFNIFILFLINLYIYIVPFLNLFLKKKTIKKYFFKNYIKNSIKLLKLTNIPNKIIFKNKTKINKKTWNMIISNHTSIIDNIIIIILVNKSKLNWNNGRTVSKISSKKTQNKILKFFDCLLINKNLYHDSNVINSTLINWKKEKKPLNIILFPEGNIFLKNNLNTDKNKINFLNKLNINNYDQVLFPNIGIFELLKNYLSKNIKYIYNLTVIYHIDNKRLYGEKNIFLNLTNPKLKITVDIQEININDINDTWLFYEWDRKNNFINEFVKHNE